MAAVNIIDLTVRRIREGSGQGKGSNKASETYGVNPAHISQIRPSLCRKDGAVDGLVNSEVLVIVGEGAGLGGALTRLWVTETESAIKTLTNA